MHNFNPQHVFTEMSDICQEAAFCHVCGHDKCKAAKEETDYGMAGIPCTPFSILNPNRFDENVDPFEQEAAKPFFFLQNFLEKSPYPPRVMILENVVGMTVSSKSKPAPIDFILNGVIRHGKHKIKVGLNFLTRYMASPVLRLNSRLCGLPVTRSRIFLVLLRKDCFSEHDMQEIVKAVTILQEVTFVPGVLDDFIVDSDSEEDVQIAVTKRRKTEASAAALNLRTPLL